MTMSEHAVLISGASSGIGAATAQRLAHDGFVVFAGTRTEADAKRTGELHDRIRPVPLDVANEGSIAAAADTIAASGLPLFATINNAGIALGGPLEYLPIGDLRNQFEVNVFGALALTQAMLPMLRTTRGRVIMIGSIAGRLAAPFLGPYSASKAALASLTDALRMELAPSGIRVSLFEFAAVKTPIWSKGQALKDELVQRLPREALDRYAPVIDAIGRQLAHEERVGIKPAIVADAIAGALASSSPRERYLVGSQARMQAVIALLPSSTKDRLIRSAMKLP
jgi:NAD(P)-dependent dehydrogenase (short-subunit alcohol dehydrogenase family)